MQKRPMSKFECAVVIGLLGLIALILAILGFHPLPEVNQSLFSAVTMGGVVAAFLLWAQFRWATSSEQKDAHIAELTNHLVNMAKANQANTTPVPPAPPVEGAE